MKKKKVLLLLSIVLFSINGFAQNKEYNSKEILEAIQHSTPQILEHKDTLTLKFLDNDWSIKKGDTIQIFLPANGRADYMFIKKKKGLFSTKLLKQVAEVVSVGAIAVGLGSDNLDVILKALDVSIKANAVSYGADALDKIQDLDISKNSKKIAGKKAKVLGWNIVDDEYIVDVKIGKKKYEINYASAILLNEIKFIEKKKERNNDTNCLYKRI